MQIAEFRSPLDDKVLLTMKNIIQYVLLSGVYKVLSILKSFPPPYFPNLKSFPIHVWGRTSGQGPTAHILDVQPVNPYDGLKVLFGPLYGPIILLQN